MKTVGGKKKCRLLRRHRTKEKPSYPLIAANWQSFCSNGLSPQTPEGISIGETELLWLRGGKRHEDRSISSQSFHLELTKMKTPTCKGGFRPIAADVVNSTVRDGVERTANGR